MDGAAVDEENKACLVALNVIKEAPAKVSWERLGALDFIGLGQYLESGHFDVLPVKGRYI